MKEIIAPIDVSFHTVYLRNGTCFANLGAKTVIFPKIFEKMPCFEVMASYFQTVALKPIKSGAAIGEMAQANGSSHRATPKGLLGKTIIPYNYDKVNANEAKKHESTVNFVAKGEKEEKCST